MKRWKAVVVAAGMLMPAALFLTCSSSSVAAEAAAAPRVAQGECLLSHCEPLHRFSRSESVRGLRECGVREEDSYEDVEAGYIAMLPPEPAAAVAAATCLIRIDAPNAIGMVEVAAGFRWLGGQRQVSLTLHILALRALVARSAKIERSYSSPEDIEDWQTHVRRKAETILRNAAEDGIALTAEDRAFVTATTRFVQPRSDD